LVAVRADLEHGIRMGRAPLILRGAPLPLGAR